MDSTVCENSLILTSNARKTNPSNHPLGNGSDLIRSPMVGSRCLKKVETTNDQPNITATKLTFQVTGMVGGWLRMVRGIDGWRG